MQPMTLEQAKSFLTACKGHRLEALFTVALSLGLRKGEALGLRWEDVDWQGQQLRIRKSLQRVNGKLELVDLKTESSLRTLPLTSELISTLKEHRKRQLEGKMLAGSEWQDNGLIFTSTIGSALDGSDVSRFFFKVLEKADLPRFRFHDLRHSCASLLFAQGVPARTVQDILGHSRISMTMDIYTHIMPQARLQAIDLLGSIMAGGRK
jgi:integrase